MIEEIIEEMTRYGFTLTTGQVEKYLQIKRAKKDINECGFDTVARESYLETLSQKIMGKSWPCGGTPKEEQEEFLKELGEKAAVHNYKWKMWDE